MNAITRVPGSFAYPTRNFARILLKVSQEAGLYLDLPFWPDDPGRKVSEGSLLIQGLPCGLSPCPPDFYCPLGRGRVQDGCARSFPHMVQFY